MKTESSHLLWQPIIKAKIFNKSAFLFIGSTLLRQSYLKTGPSHNLKHDETKLKDVRLATLRRVWGRFTNTSSRVTRRLFDFEVRTAQLLPSLLALALAGCSTTRPVDYRDLASTSQLSPNSADKVGHLPFVYTRPGVTWATYTNFILDPVVVYAGQDSQFGETSTAEREKLASYMYTQNLAALETRYTLVKSAGANTLSVHLTITGVERSIPVISTLTKVVPGGVLINTIQTSRDKQASFTGSITYAVEIYDSVSDQLLRAYITKQYPWAENVAVSFGTLDAARAGIRNGARELLTQLH